MFEVGSTGPCNGPGLGYDKFKCKKDCNSCNCYCNLRGKVAVAGGCTRLWCKNFEPEARIRRKGKQGMRIDMGKGRKRKWIKKSKVAKRAMVA